MKIKIIDGSLLIMIVYRLNIIHFKYNPTAKNPNVFICVHWDFADKIINFLNSLMVTFKI